MNPRIYLLAVVILAIFAGGTFLATRTVPAPRHTIEKVIGNDRFFK